MTIEDLFRTPEPRSGPRPKTAGPAPHSQVDQLPPPHLRKKLTAVLLDALVRQSWENARA